MISIRVPKNQNRVVLFEKAKVLAARNGVKLSGCVASGEFSAPQRGVKGTYKTQGDFLKVTLTKKPCYIPEALVKKQLTSFFS